MDYTVLYSCYCSVAVFRKAVVVQCCKLVKISARIQACLIFPAWDVCSKTHRLNQQTFCQLYILPDQC